MSGLNIGKNIVIGKEVGIFKNQKDAVDAAKINSGSEIIYKKDNEWHVDEVKEKGLVHDSNLSKLSENKLEINNKTSKNMTDLSISFVEDDIKPEDRTKFAKTTSSEYVLDKLASEKPLMKSLQNLGMMDNDMIRVKTQVAANHNTSPETLETMSKTEHLISITSEIAKNPNTNPNTLAGLASAESPVAKLVAANPNTPTKSLEELYQKKNFSINQSLASNPNTPVIILDSLAKGDDDIKNIVLNNPSFSKKIKH